MFLEFEAERASDYIHININVAVADGSKVVTGIPKINVKILKSEHHTIIHHVVDTGTRYPADLGTAVTSLLASTTQQDAGLQSAKRQTASAIDQRVTSLNANSPPNRAKPIKACVHTVI